MSYTWENPAARDAAEQSKLFWKEPKIFSEMHEGKVLYGFENMYGKVVPATFERIWCIRCRICKCIQRW